jgi:formylglycine-generating enzyme required for sulfatase activity
MEYAVGGQPVRSAVLLVALSVAPSCGICEFDENLGPPAFCANPPFGHDAEEDAVFLRERGATVARNEFESLEASFANGMEFVYVPKGPFHMGTDDWGPDEQPVHEVFLHGYWIGKNLVTNEQFAAFVEASGFETDAERLPEDGCYVFIANPNRPGGDWIATPGTNWRNAFDDHPTDPYYRNFDNLGQHPVGCVSWYDAMAYAGWLSDQLGLPVSLPTEAQWEKAARGSDGRVWPWGNEPPDATRSNFADASFDTAYEQPNQGDPTLEVDDGWSATSPVGLFPAGASPYGVLDMSGNTTQWVFDLLGRYSEGAQTNPMGPTGGSDRTMRVMRGGFWIASAGSLTPSRLEIRIKHTTRADLRAWDDPRTSDDHLGFRVVIDGCERP